MRPALRVLRALAALGGAAALVVPVFTVPAGAADQTVQVGANGTNRFTPATVRIRVNDTVTWQWAGGSGHNVTSTTSNWDKADPVGPPDVLAMSTSYKFDAVGTYRYVCTTHESVGMKGTVVVETRPRPTASPTPTKTSAPPSPRPSPTLVPSPTSGSPTPSASATPSPSASLVSGTPTLSPPPSGPTFPTGSPQATFLGTGGLRPQPATGREKGLPVMLALLLIGGVGSAELRALLAHAPRP